MVPGFLMLQDDIPNYQYSSDNYHKNHYSNFNCLTHFFYYQNTLTSFTMIKRSKSVIILMI
jgi:hypothetical protein